MADKPKTLVLFHKHCADGMCAAYIAKQRLPADAEFVPIAYGERPPDVTGRRVYMLDFSFKAPVMEKIIVEATGGVVALDHHKTAKPEFEKLNAPHLGQHWHYVFDENRSGARLTWDYFYSGMRPPNLVLYTEDRDLWRWRLPFSKEINAFIRSYPFTLEAYRELDLALDENIDETHWTVAAGRAILRYEETVRDKLISNAIDVEVQGHKVKMVNAPILQSEIGEKLAIEHGPMSLMFWVRADGVTEFGLRSRSDFDVSEVAKRLGGGGHAQAAGFQHRLPLPFVPTEPGNADQGRLVDILASQILQMVQGASESYMANLQMANAWLHDRVRVRMSEILEGVKNGPGRDEDKAA